MAKRGRRNNKRFRQTSFYKWWKKWKPKFLQKIGCLFLFILCLLGLFLILIYKFNSTPSPGDDFYQEVSYQEQAAFIAEIAPISQSLQREFGILASISLAQAALESNYGKSQLAAEYYNLFGVKTEKDDPNGIDLPTLEFIDGEMIEIVDRFKVYSSWEASLRAHAELLYYGTTWDSDYYKDVRLGRDYLSQAKGLQSSGYATDPDYASKIIEMIEAKQLYQYDQPLE